MNQNTPPTRAEAREAVEQLAQNEQTVRAYTGELEAIPVEPAPEFLPLAVRRVLYIAGLVGLVAAPLVGVSFPEYELAISTGANLLGAAALGTALANPPARAR